ncbi:MAG: carboxypeptidase regulatory-like domain-containing protein [Acidobacteria bacterium]|nr:carboxypeptidase regulatory-like domain-containing protein [Acidobacteriota bacterium]
MRTAIFVLTTIALAAQPRPTANGVIMDAATNQPIANATVLVYAAGVRSGYNLFCPTCYTDCGKRATTNESGEFTIANLSADLVFDLLVVRDGFSSTWIKKVDPLSNTKAQAKLAKRTSPENPKQIVRGKVVDARGDAVRDALIAQRGIIFDQGRSFGDRDWIDLVAVSNKDGEFEMAFGKPAKAMILQVAPRGMASSLVTLTTGAGRQSITATDGATVRGRVVNNGKPLANIELGLSTHSRMSGTVFDDMRIGTNESGEFAITNVPAGRIYDLFPRMTALGEKGLSAEVTYVETKDDGQEVHIGDIQTQPAYTLKGRVVLSDGAAIPANIRVNLFLDRMPDSQTVMLGPDGEFEFRGLARGVYSVSPAVKGYIPLDPEKPLEFLIDHDRADANITLKPGSRF